MAIKYDIGIRVFRHLIKAMYLMIQVTFGDHKRIHSSIFYCIEAKPVTIPIRVLVVVATTGGVVMVVGVASVLVFGARVKVTVDDALHVLFWQNAAN